jgi:hypothetical protein
VPIVVEVGDDWVEMRRPETRGLHSLMESKFNMDMQSNRG